MKKNKVIGTKEDGEKIEIPILEIEKYYISKYEPLQTFDLMVSIPTIPLHLLLGMF